MNLQQIMAVARWSKASEMSDRARSGRRGEGSGDVGAALPNPKVCPTTQRCRPRRSIVSTPRPACSLPGRRCGRARHWRIGPPDRAPAPASDCRERWPRSGHRRGNAAGIDAKVALAARRAAIGRARDGTLAPFWPGHSPRRARRRWEQGHDLNPQAVGKRWPGDADQTRCRRHWSHVMSGALNGQCPAQSPGGRKLSAT